MKKSSEFWELLKEDKITESEFWGNLIDNSPILKILRISKLSNFPIVVYDSGGDKVESGCRSEIVEWFKINIRCTFGMYNEINKILEILKKKKIVLGVLSNHSKDWIKEGFNLNKKLLKEYFHKDLVIVSCDVKVSKPKKEIFKILFKKIAKIDKNIILSEIVFVDDKMKNIKGAQSCGLKNSFLFNARFEDFSVLQQKLEKLCGIKYKN